ncbi:hypothetical protein CZP2022_269 [Vibrio phage C-ZP2022]|nr:hypothetical protein CZP2022_269 [Vibrio phage C-ZP2022]
MITRLYLKGFIPMGFCGVVELEYTPKSLLQIIVGTNGSGKSSLLRALSLVPLDKKEFQKGGCRELEVEENGVAFKMVSHYKGSAPHHEFWMGDVNLNQGGTSAVQKQLVESHFGYTAFHHKLLTGKLQFTEMSPNGRKDLLIMISGLELDYALEVFDKLRIAHRDIQGALKHLRGKYADAAKQLASMQNTDELEQEAAKLQEELTTIIPRTNFSVDVSLHENAIQLVQNKILSVYRGYTQLVKKLQSLAPEYSNRDGDVPVPLEGVKDRVSKDEHRLEDIGKKIQTNVEEFGQLEEQAAKFANLPEDTNKGNLEKEIEKLEAEYKEYPRQPQQEVPNLEGYMQELLECHAALLNYMEVFPDVPVIFKRDDIESTTEKHNHLTGTISNLKSGISAIKQKIAHAEAAREGNIQCPECKTEILADGALSLDRINALKQELREEEIKLENEEKAFALVDAERQKQYYYMDALKHLRGIAMRYPQTRTIMAPDSPAQVMTGTRNSISNLHQEHLAVKDAISRRDLEKTISEKKLLLSLMNVSGKEKILSRFKAVESELNELYRLKTEIEESYRRNQTIRAILQKMGEAMNALSNYEKEFMIHCHNLAKAMGEKATNDVVREKQSHLAMMNKTIHDYQLVENRLKELDEEEKALSAKKASFEVLLHCLSSNRGLVGEQLLTVISAVSRAINDIIGDVWEKELKLVVPEFGKKLDFQFFTQIEGLNGPDIKDLSAGQKEIVNFAMTMVVMRQLGLTNFPLLLDETSANMDPLHRGNFMKYIRDLVDNGEFRSIFLVSHYASEYGGFTNADLVVMNPDNIGVPSGAYNENIQLR